MDLLISSLSRLCVWGVGVATIILPYLTRKMNESSHNCYKLTNNKTRIFNPPPHEGFFFYTLFKANIFILVLDIFLRWQFYLFLLKKIRLTWFSAILKFLIFWNEVITLFSELLGQISPFLLFCRHSFYQFLLSFLWETLNIFERMETLKRSIHSQLWRYFYAFQTICS